MVKKLGEKGITIFTTIIVAVIVTALIVGPAAYVLKPAAVEKVEAEKEVTLAIEHFSVIAGTTWSGAHNRAAIRLTRLYPWLKYLKAEEIMPDMTNPVARDLIARGADIVVGNAEFMGLPLKEIADEYENVYFVSIIASDLSTKRNFIRYFPRQYQAMYLEGLVAGAITRENKIGIVSGPICVQNLRRAAAFYLGIKDANPRATLYVKYVGEWYNPSVETEIARTLVDTYRVDVLTQYSDSSAPLDVAEDKGIWFIGKDMDIVGQYGWSSTDTVAVSFDTRWEVGYDKMIKEYLAGVRYPRTVQFIGMSQPMAVPSNNEIVPGATLIPIVDLQNDNKIGVDAISPRARPLIPDNIVELIRTRREQMMLGVWDPFLEHALVSGGTGIEITELGLAIPARGTVVKAAGVMPSDEFLLARLNFHLDGIVYIA
jgi:basic membrane lipoprotein Med (substrate-binding protein (PBP1-ABC) superfamily)